MSSGWGTHLARSSLDIASLDWLTVAPVAIRVSNITSMSSPFALCRVHD